MTDPDPKTTTRKNHPETNLTTDTQPPERFPEKTTTKEWMNHAACKGLTHLMFPKEHKDITYIQEAREICASCSVSEQCLNYALEFPVADMHGIWAGLTSRQLGAEQRRRGITPVRPTLAQLWGA